MSIKSLRIDPTTIPNPPTGYTYLGSGNDGELFIKLDDGTIKTYISGIDNLYELKDVLITSGITINQALVWDGNYWTNASVIPDLSNYFTKQEINSGLTSLETSISSESSNRIYYDLSLETSINNKSGVTSLSSLSDVVLTSLSNNDVLIYSTNKWVNSTPIDFTSNLTEGQLLKYLNGTLVGTNDILTGLTSSIATETSLRIVADTSLTTKLSSEITTRSSVDSSLEGFISTEIHNRITGDTSLETKLNNLVLTDIKNVDIINLQNNDIIKYNSGSTKWENNSVLDLTNNFIENDIVIYKQSTFSGLTFNLTGLTSSVSTETSLRIVADASLTTKLSSEITTRSSVDTILSTSISSEISNRIVADTSLQTSINNITGGTGGSSTLSGCTDVLITSLTDKNILVYSGGTINKWINEPMIDITSQIINGDLIYLSGSTLSGCTYPYIQIVSSGSSHTLVSTDHGKILEYNDNSTITLPNGLPVGFQCVIMNMGSNKTITLTATTTLYSKLSKTTIINQYGGVTVYHRGSNVWVAVGDLA